MRRIRTVLPVGTNDELTTPRMTDRPAAVPDAR
jgi:hypothetical protein